MIKSSKGPNVYIGSTVKEYICNRYSDHTSKYRLTKGGRVASWDLFDEYGLENCTYELVEKCSLNDKLHRERYWIENTPHCVNKARPVITEEEHKELKSDSYQRLKAKNPEKFKERSKISGRKAYEKKYEILCECGVIVKSNYKRHLESATHKQYYEQGHLLGNLNEYLPKVKRDRKEVSKAWQDNNKGRYKEKCRERSATFITCECGMVIMKGNVTRHLRSNHLRK